MDIVCFRILVTVGKWILLIEHVPCSLAFIYYCNDPEI